LVGWGATDGIFHHQRNQFYPLWDTSQTSFILARFIQTIFKCKCKRSKCIFWIFFFIFLKKKHLGGGKFVWACEGVLMCVTPLASASNYWIDSKQKNASLNLNQFIISICLTLHQNLDYWKSYLKLK